LFNIHPKHGSNIYSDSDGETEEDQSADDDDDDDENYRITDDDSDYEDEDRMDYKDEEIHNASVNEAFEDYDERKEDKEEDEIDSNENDDYEGQDEGGYNNPREVSDQQKTETTPDTTKERFDALSFEKEDHELDVESAKFDESKIKEKSEKVTEQTRKQLDNKFLKDLGKPSRSKGFSPKQEEHSPYSFAGHRLSRSKPFRSFKEYMEKTHDNVKVVSNSKAAEENQALETFDTGEYRGQKVAKNSPPSDPSKYNTDGTIEEDIVEGIPKKIKTAIKKLPQIADRAVHKVKNIII